MNPNSSPSYTFLDNTPNLIKQHLLHTPTTTNPITTEPLSTKPNSPLSASSRNPHPSTPGPNNYSPSTPPIVGSSSLGHNQIHSSNTSSDSPVLPHVVDITQPTLTTNLVSTHPMITRFHVGTNRPTQCFNLNVSTISPFPKTYTHAFNDPNWHSAMLDEYNNLIKNSAWVLVPRPPNVNVVRSMWLFRHKHNAYGSLSRYKACLVANGSTQLSSIDVDENFSPMLDVKNGFLHGSLSETVYMHQPPGFRDPQHPDHVRLLQRLLCSLKQAPWAWFKRFATYATRVGFHHIRYDSSLFIYRQGTDTPYLLLYVDDIVLTASSLTFLRRVIASLHAEFSMSDLGTLNYFLGISVTRNTSGTFLSQKKYATKVLEHATMVLEHAHMITCNPCQTLVDTESKLAADSDPIFDPTLYRSVAGALQYLIFTRPDISYDVQQVCLFMHNPREPHFSDLKQILRYIRGTLDYGLQLYLSSTSSLVAYSDVDWTGCHTTRMSTSGYCVFQGNNLFSWSSKHQFTLSRSTAKVGYRGVANALTKTYWLRNLLRELHTPLSSTTLVYCDNVSVVYLSSNHVQHHCIKHIEIDIHFVCDLVSMGHVQDLHVLSRYQYADIFTKGLPTDLFDEFRSSLSVRSSPTPTARDEIKLEDLSKLVLNLDVDFMDLDSRKDDHPIIVEDEEGEEVHTKEDQDEEFHTEDPKETKDASASHPLSPSSLPTKLIELPLKFNDLTREIKELKKHVYELKIELPEDLN
uniref:Ribonuclease H-like domain-containing protein n=1 Tax=Tanacetum cinerariifolium TaxID=118510 RepID=A0A6L2LIU5_TANCI|nr:ribonuclease H-like domain-containing protein [Tanacetum cinerariifolium]